MGRLTLRLVNFCFGTFRSLRLNLASMLREHTAKATHRSMKGHRAGADNPVISGTNYKVMCSKRIFTLASMLSAASIEVLGFSGIGLFSIRNDSEPNAPTALTSLTFLVIEGSAINSTSVF